MPELAGKHGQGPGTGAVSLGRTVVEDILQQVEVLFHDLASLARGIAGER